MNARHGVGEDAVPADHRRDDVPAEIMCTRSIFCVFDYPPDEHVGREDIYAHAYQAFIVAAGDRLGIIGFLLEPDDAVISIHLHDAETPCFFAWNSHRTDGEIRVRIGVRNNHSGVVHEVYVIPGEDERVRRALFLQRVDILENRVGGALVPGTHHSLLWRYLNEKFAHFIAEERPPLLQVAIQ